MTTPAKIALILITLVNGVVCAAARTQGDLNRHATLKSDRPLVWAEGVRFSQGYNSWRRARERR